MRTFLAAGLLLAAIVAAAFAFNRVLSGDAPGSVPVDPGREVAAAAPGPASARQPVMGEVVPQAARNVTPDGFTPGPDVSGPLVRVEGVKPPPPKPRFKRFFRVLVTDAGSMRAGRIKLQLAGISGPPADEVCDDGRTGTTWPCGRRARSQLRRLIRGRAIDCRLETETVPAVLVTDCRVGKTDLALWMVTGGWARISDAASDELVAAHQTAKAERRGLWKSDN